MSSSLYFIPTIFIQRGAGGQLPSPDGGLLETDLPVPGSILARGWLAQQALCPGETAAPSGGRGQGLWRGDPEAALQIGRRGEFMRLRVMIILLRQKLSLLRQMSKGPSISLFSIHFQGNLTCLAKFNCTGKAWFCIPELPCKYPVSPAKANSEV